MRVYIQIGYIGMVCIRKVDQVNLYLLFSNDGSFVSHETGPRYESSTDTMQCGDAFPDFVWFGDIGYYMASSAYNYGGGLAFCRSLNAEYPTMHDETYWNSLVDFLRHSERTDSLKTLQLTVQGENTYCAHRLL